MRLGRSSGKLLAAIAAGCAISFVSAAKAQTVTNPSFQTPATGGFIDDGNGAINNPTNSGFWGWGYFFANTSVDHDAGVQANANCSILASADGSTQNGWVNGAGNYLYQDVGALAANTTYTLTVAVAAPGGTSYGGTGSGNAQPTDTIEMLNGTNTLTTSNNIAAVGSVLATSGIITPPNGSYADQTISFSTGASPSGDLTLLLEENTAGAHEQGIFDDVRLSATPVPEPATVSLLGGTALMLMYRRRRA